MPTYRVTLKHRFYSEVGMNVLHFEGDETLTPPPTQAVCQEVIDNWVPQIRVVPSSQQAWFEVRADLLGAGGTIPETTTVPFVAQGAGISDTSLALNSVYVLIFGTGLQGRKMRGRSFIGPVKDGHLSTGLMASGAHTAWATPITNLSNRFLIGGSNPGPLKLVIHHGGNADDFTHVTSIGLRTTPGSMRSRMKSGSV